MSVIDEIKDRIDAVDLIGETVKLRKSGKNYSGFCPFHPNSRTPAFVVFPDTGTWRCFGACNEGGDIFSFVMKKEGWDFPEALRVLAERAGVQLETQTPEREAAQEAQEALQGVLEMAVAFYRHQLVRTEAGRPVLDYLHQRGLKDEALEAFEIGYAPLSWDAMLDHLKGKGVDEGDLVKVGLTGERDDGGLYDRFRNRIMIPIRNARGGLAGFGARVVDPQDVPKFLNSPQTVLFDKSRLLYGLDKARKPIRAEGQSVIVEGYLDVIALHQAGFTNVVSPMGTALSEGQLRLLKRFGRRMLLALDADAAGDQATLRGLSVARGALDREMDPVFDARGLVRYEGRLDAEVRVVTLPEGKDPDEVVAEDPKAWARLLESSQPVVVYVLKVLTSSRDVDDPKVKADITRQILPLIEDVADPVEREAYRQQLARRLKVDERALIGARPAAPSKRPQAARREALAPLRDSADVKVERFCLGLLLQDPELLYRIDREFQGLDLDRLSAADFTGTDQRVIFHGLQQSLHQDDEEPARFWRNVLEGPLVEVADELLGELSELAEFIKLDLRQPKSVDEVTARFLWLRMRNLDQAVRQLRFQIEEAQEQESGEQADPDVIWSLTRQVQRLAPQRLRLEQALARRQRSLEVEAISQES